MKHYFEQNLYETNFAWAHILGMIAQETMVCVMLVLGGETNYLSLETFLSMNCNNYAISL